MMQFAHIHASTKIAAVAEMVRQRRAVQAIEAEIVTARVTPMGVLTDGQSGITGAAASKPSSSERRHGELRRNYRGKKNNKDKEVLGRGVKGGEPPRPPVSLPNIPSGIGI